MTFSRLVGVDVAPAAIKNIEDDGIGGVSPAGPAARLPQRLVMRGGTFLYHQRRIHRESANLKTSETLHANRAEIRRVVQAHRARNARVFGSVMRGEDTEDSDVDILIDPTPEMTLFDLGAIRHELRQLLGVSVDVLTPNALPDKFRARVIAEARPV